MDSYLQQKQEQNSPPPTPLPRRWYDRFGLTCWLGYYTDAEFDAMVTKVITLTSSYTAVVVWVYLLYWAIKIAANKTSDSFDFFDFVTMSSWFCFNTIFLILDSIFRTALPGFRILGELGTLSALCFLWSLVGCTFLHSEGALFWVFVFIGYVFVFGIPIIFVIRKLRM